MDRPTALARAEEWRTRRADLLDALAEGSIGLPDALSAARDDPAWGEVKLLAVLEAVPGARKVATRRAMAALGLGERLRVRELDAAQVAAIVASFPPGEGR